MAGHDTTNLKAKHGVTINEPICTFATLPPDRSRIINE
jgi:hypothetical protein